MNNLKPELSTKGKGFTLVEVIVACALSLILVTVMIAAAVNYQRIFKTQNSINDMTQNVRAAMDLVARDMRTAGYGLDDSASANMVNWITWVSGFNANPLVVDGGSGPDTVYIAGAFTEPIGYLTADVPIGGTVLVLDGGGSQVNMTDKKVIFVGRLETARVIGLAGNTLTISTHPSSAAGLSYSYSAGAPVEVVSLLTYQVVDNPSLYPYGPHLQRIDSTTPYAYDWQRIAAGNIEDLQVTGNGGTMEIEIQGRTSKPDDGYTDPDYGDHYRRFRLETTIHRRN
ncbi:MAG TPA: prepilin-type N-terminal cleavage/methylation domain-containing protein [Kiritimatiellia bacterium]|nr:prepilin-type N-terminal cleavage/methylation domain-containing protein [Kiritimatiellia bacterium]HNS79983.1 prepilin-type N-terminal cleavage/methylation domain-containing protein [Kiritimatiellia bacterium]HPA77074.1 prepilin-type N-terminal cleavage/methylation domain-containing protein [Kiritimatiellia bacterium]HQQ03369.1 prepilin-type N-terminal cleavage/methylation domain-containing protein [Kiritimatiellia bacterium]